MQLTRVRDTARPNRSDGFKERTRRGRAIMVVASPFDDVRALAEISGKKRTELQMFATEIQTDVRDIATALQKASETTVNEFGRPAPSSSQLWVACMQSGQLQFH